MEISTRSLSLCTGGLAEHKYLTLLRTDVVVSLDMDIRR